MPTEDLSVPGLSVLLSAAAQLNQASDEVNKVLKRLEAQLNTANVGMPFWFEDRPLYQSDTVGDVGSRAISERTAVLLGYDRVEDHWCLAIKTMRYASGFFEGDMSCPFTNVYAEGGPTPLLKATRDLRVAAVRSMTEFLTAFADYVRRTVGEIEAATGELFF